MAIPAQGFTFTWGGTPLLEVQELEVDLQRGLPLGRITTFTPTLGEVRLLAFSSSGLPTSEYGRRKRLTIQCPIPSGGSITICDVDCIYQDANYAAVANGAVRFVHVFKIMDTVGAPTNP
jgi:hypothetical protein